MTTIWTLPEAVELINKLRETAEECNLGISLSGSVLFKGSSTNDLDIVLYPFKTGVPDRHEDFLKLIEERFRITPKAVIDHFNNNDQKLIWVARTRPDWKRIDFIFSHLQFDRTKKYHRLVISTPKYEKA